MPVTELRVAEPWLHLHPEHGEGVVWDGRAQRLLMVDLLGGRVFRIDVATQDTESFEVPGTADAVHPTVEPDTYVVADSDGIALLRNGKLERLVDPLADRPDLRMNDANVDPAGRYFVGSMAFDKRDGAGNLYRLGLDGRLDVVVPGTTISNGIDWSPDGRLCYFIDTPTRRVDVFDYDVDTGELTGRREFLDTREQPGFPDGLTVDADGGVWVAFYDGARVCRYTPDGALDVIVHLPTSRTTSCCFGGPELRDLFVCSSTEDMSAEQLAAEPLAGALFRVDTGFAGRPAHRFVLPP